MLTGELTEQANGGNKCIMAKVVLHVEDSEDDAFFLQRAVTKNSPALTVRRVSDGGKALEYLTGAGAFKDRERFPLPELVLLDLKLPGLDGFDVLAWTRAQPALHNLPIFVLSSSALESDIRKAKELGADRYLVKSADFKEAADAVRKLLN